MYGYPTGTDYKDGPGHWGLTGDVVVLNMIEESSFTTREVHST